MSKPLPDHTFELKKLVRSHEKALKELSESVLLYLGALDDAVAKRRDIPDDVSRWLGKTAGDLELHNDRIRYFNLGVDYRKDDKKKARARIILARNPAPASSEEPVVSDPIVGEE